MGDSLLWKTPWNVGANRGVRNGLVNFRFVLKKATGNGL